MPLLLLHCISCQPKKYIEKYLLYKRFLWLFRFVYSIYLYYDTSCKRSVARRVTVLLPPQTLVIKFVILSKESFKKKAVCYSIKHRSKLLLLQKEANTTMKWSHVKTFVFYCFYCLTSIFVLFCFCEINFDVYDFSKLSNF